MVAESVLKSAQIICITQYIKYGLELCNDRSYPYNWYSYSQCGGACVELCTSVISIQQVGEVKVQVIEFRTSE